MPFGAPIWACRFRIEGKDIKRMGIRQGIRKYEKEEDGRLKLFDEMMVVGDGGRNFHCFLVV